MLFYFLFLYDCSNLIFNVEIEKITLSVNHPTIRRLELNATQAPGNAIVGVLPPCDDVWILTPCGTTVRILPPYDMATCV
jgi:hypothetical protein